MTLGERLRKLRNQANLTLRELGAKVGADFTYLSKIENDKTDERPPSEDLLKKLAALLGADEEELLFLAKRVPKDAREFLAKDVRAIKFLRTMKGMSEEDLDKLLKQAEKMMKEKRK